MLNLKIFIRTHWHNGDCQCGMERYYSILGMESCLAHITKVHGITRIFSLPSRYTFPIPSRYPDSPTQIILIKHRPFSRHYSVGNLHSHFPLDQHDGSASEWYDWSVKISRDSGQGVNESMLKFEELGHNHENTCLPYQPPASVHSMKK